MTSTWTPSSGVENPSSDAPGPRGPASSGMDIHNLWNDNPEEVLLDLGFGRDEPDLSGRIPARFINHQSQARGINLQVFLDAQKNRLDLENPDVSSRFRQLEVLQQVTTTFSSLVGSSSSPLRVPLGNLPPEARERRKRMSALLRRAAKKSQSHVQDITIPDATSHPSATPESLPPQPGPEDKSVSLKRVKPGLQETVRLSPLVEEQGASPDPHTQPLVASFNVQEGPQRSGPLRDGCPATARKSLWQTRESFEMEEIQSFDESSITGSNTGAPEHLVRGMIRTSSCQSDSSGFLEEASIPALPQQTGAELIKALSGLSGGSSDSQTSDRPGSGSGSAHMSSAAAFATSETSSHRSSGPSPELSADSPSVLSCHTKSEPRALSAEMEVPPDQDPTPPSPPTTSLALPSPPQANASSSTSSPMQTASLTRESCDLTPPPNVSTVSHDSEGLTCSTSSNPFHPSPTSSVNLEDPSPAMFLDSGAPCERPEDAQPEQMEEAPSAAGGSSSPLLLSPSSSPPSSPSSCPSSSSSLPSHCSEDHEKDSLLLYSARRRGEEEPSALASLILDPSGADERCPSNSCLAQSPTHLPLCQLSVSSSHNPDSLIDPVSGRISEVKDQERSRGPDQDTDPAHASPVQDVTDVRMVNVSVDTLQRSDGGEEEDKMQADTVQIHEHVVYISDTESSAGLSEGCRLVSEEVCYETEIGPELASCTLRERVAETEQGESSKVAPVESDDKGKKESESSLPEAPNTQLLNKRGDRGASDLIEIESLDLVFETSVDGSEGADGDEDAFLHQLDAEEQVYWAEPIVVTDTSPVLGESGRSDRCPGNTVIPLTTAASFTDAASGQAASSETSSSSSSFLSSLSSSAAHVPLSSLSMTSDLKSSCHSVSVQMSSSPSSHIVHRRDVPYSTERKCNVLPSVLPLDTSTPFRAVQSWTDIQMQRNTLSKKLSPGACHAFPNQLTVSTSASEMTQRPTEILPSSPSECLLCNSWQSCECHSGVTRHDSVNVDTELWPGEGGDQNGNEHGGRQWEAHQTVTREYCDSCDHQCGCHTQKGCTAQQTRASTSFSLDELEEMMLCLQHFHSVLSNMEEQLSEDQAAVYTSLSQQDRETIQDIEELRRAVKQEARELEKQLTELAHDYDDSLKKKMRRLLDEQSLLCSQLQVAPPASTSPSIDSSRTVATQCCLLPSLPPADGPRDHASSWNTWNTNSLRASPPGPGSILSCSSSKPDQLDILDFTQTGRPEQPPFL